MIAFRPAQLHDKDRDDRAFIRSTWARAFKYSHDAGMIHTDDWPEVMHKQINRALDRPDARAIICCADDDADYFFGWIAGDTSGRTPVVFYCYVKEPSRRQGVGARLLEALGVDALKPFIYTCRGPSAMSHFRHRIPLARYYPPEVRYPKDTRKEAHGK